MAGTDMEADRSSKQRQDECGILSFLFLLSGIYGLLLFCGSIEGVAYSALLVYPAAALYCALLWRFWEQRRRWFRVSVFASALSCFAAAFLMRHVLWEQIRHIMLLLCRKEGAASMDVTEFVLLSAISLSLLLFISEFVLEEHMIWYLLTTALLILAPVLNMRVSAGTLLLMVLFRTGFQAGVNSRLAAAAIMMFVFIMAGIFTPLYAERLYEAAYDIDGFFQRSLLKVSGKSEEAVSEGMISGRNHYRTGTVLLELTASSHPTETLYLKGFEGGEYIGGEWTRSDDEALFERMAEKIGWQQWGYMIGDLYFPMYFVMNQSTLTEEQPEPISLTICHTAGNYENLYVPYYRRRERGWGQNRYLNPSNHWTDSGQSGYSYLYYEQKDMRIDWNHVGKDFEEQRNWYREIQASYMEEAEEIYTQVPKELLPGLVKLVEENPLTDQNDITLFILDTLHNNAAYTLTPGWAPLNEDIVEYFLFERKSGYCVHFASAASLMYRLYGIPARYVSGYAVQPDAFAPEEDGNFHADVTDAEAHAWVEILLPDYGWTPVDVTPAENGEAAASYPGFDSTEQNRYFKKKQRESERQNMTDEEESAYAKGEKGADRFFPDRIIDFAAYRDLFLVLGTCIGCFVLLIPLFLDYRGLRRRRRMEGMDCQGIFVCLMKLLHSHGKFQDADGLEPDFAKKLTELAPELTEQEAGLFLQTVYDASYGPVKEESHLDVERALWVYRSVEKALGSGKKY